MDLWVSLELTNALDYPCPAFLVYQTSIDYETIGY